ncbi:MAG: hypothetical protein RIS84_1348 [Pseudomonadota bacterium]|jgi:hypothetical protein
MKYIHWGLLLLSLNTVALADDIPEWQPFDWAGIIGMQRGSEFLTDKGINGWFKAGSSCFTVATGLELTRNYRGQGTVAYPYEVGNIWQAFEVDGVRGIFDGVNFVLDNGIRGFLDENQDTCFDSNNANAMLRDYSSLSSNLPIAPMPTE